MSALEELELVEADLGALARDGVERRPDPRAGFSRLLVEARAVLDAAERRRAVEAVAGDGDRRRRRRPGGDAQPRTPAVIESVRGCVERGMSVEEAMVSHGLDPAVPLGRGGPAVEDEGPLIEYDGDLDGMLDELADVARERGG